MAETAKPEIQRAVAAGIAHHRAGRLAEAEEAYHKVLVTDPDNFDALCLLGAIAHGAGRHHQAVDYIGRAIAHAERATPARPPNPYAYSNLGEAYRAIGQTGDATACYEKALAIKPDYAEAHYHLGLVLADRRPASGCHRVLPQGHRVEAGTRAGPVQPRPRVESRRATPPKRPCACVRF